MASIRFSPWCRWNSREQITGIAYPGVYAVAHTRADLSGKPFSWRKDIIYVGMTNKGLKIRLRQFDNTIAGKSGHGGADRVLYKHRDYAKFVKNCFVAVVPFQCDGTSNQPSDLRMMGEVVRFEFLCLADYVERFGRLPEFNDKRVSAKFSLTVGRNKESRD